MSFWIRTKDKDGTSKARAINTSSPGILIVVATLAVTAVVIANTPMCYPRARTKATDHSRLTGLNDMFRAYDQVHGSKPHSLADLVPKYVTEEFLISPTNQLPYEYYDPPLKVGYYEVMIVRQLNRTEDLIVRALCNDGKVRVLGVDGIRTAQETRKAGQSMTSEDQPE